MFYTQSDIIDREVIEKAVKPSPKKIHLPFYDSLAEIISAADQEASAGWNAKASKETSQSRIRFTGTASWPACKQLVADGWAEGREKVSASLAEIFASGAAELSAGAAVEYAVAGSHPDVPLYVAGEVAHMFSDGSQLDAKPIIKMMVNLAADCTVPAERIANRGAAVAALVDEIESAGHSCEIIAVKPAQKNGLFYAPTVLVKPAGEPMAIDDIAFALGHPSMLRRVMFGALEADTETDGFKMHTNYGVPCDLPEASVPSDTIYLRGLVHNHAPYATPEKAMETVRDIYNKTAESNGLTTVEASR